MMRNKQIWLGVLLILNSVLGVSCVHAARDTTGFAIIDSQRFDAPFEQVWEATKNALRDEGLNLYTRDKRGVFVAFSEPKRQFQLFTPQRIKLTVNLTPISNTATEVRIETVNQIYGCTLLTYPDWHDRKAKDNKIALSVFERIGKKLRGEEEPSPISEDNKSDKKSKN